MQMQAILQRITTRREELGMSEAAVAMRGGSRDLIRNWRRGLERGQAINARYDSLALIAKALNVTEDWLIHGKGDAAAVVVPKASGMEEEASPYSLQNPGSDKADPHGPVRLLFGTAVATPALFKVNIDLPGFAMATGDVAVVDLARLPVPGEVALVTVSDDDTATAGTMVCRYLPPFLQPGSLAARPAMLRVDDPGVTVRYPVIGCIRGLAH